MIRWNELIGFSIIICVRAIRYFGRRRLKKTNRFESTSLLHDVFDIIRHYIRASIWSYHVYNNNRVSATIVWLCRESECNYYCYVLPIDLNLVWNMHRPSAHSLSDLACWTTWTRIRPWMNLKRAVDKDVEYAWNNCSRANQQLSINCSIKTCDIQYRPWIDSNGYFRLRNRDGIRTMDINRFNWAVQCQTSYVLTCWLLDVG